MKLVKVIVALAAGVVLLLVLGVVIVFVQVDRIAKAGIERGGTSVLGVKTTVRTADVGILAGTFDLAGLEIANPDGYPSPHLLTLQDADVAVTLSSLMEDTVTLPELRIGVMDINLDRTGGVANFQKILDHIGTSEKGDGGAKSEGGKKFVINTLVLEGAKVHVTGVPGLTFAAGDIAVTVPEIRLEHVGSKDPLTTREIVSLVVKTIMSATIEAGGGIIPADLLGDLRGQLDQLVGLDDLGITAVGDVGKIANTIAGKAGEAIDDAVEDVKGKVDEQIDDAKKQINDRLKGVLPGKKDDDGG